MQWAASSLSKGTSNKAWWNKSSLAVGRLLGSTSRHFWINSCKHANEATKVRSHPGFTPRVMCSQLTHSPAAVGLPGTEWHCLWLLGTHKRNLHYSGFPTQPSVEARGQRRDAQQQQWPPSCPQHISVIAQCSVTSQRNSLPLRRTFQRNKYPRLW